jgi:hypothetical protein
MARAVNTPRINLLFQFIGVRRLFSVGFRNGRDCSCFLHRTAVATAFQGSLCSLSFATSCRETRVFLRWLLILLSSQKVKIRRIAITNSKNWTFNYYLSSRQGIVNAHILSVCVKLWVKSRVALADNFPWRSSRSAGLLCGIAAGKTHSALLCGACRNGNSCRDRNRTKLEWEKPPNDPSGLARSGFRLSITVRGAQSGLSDSMAQPCSPGQRKPRDLRLAGARLPQ